MSMITQKMALELLSHEAIVREAYKDSGGVWTWSVGITSATGHDVKRYIKNPQSLEKCLEVYIWALEKYVKQVLSAFSGRTLTESQLSAAVSFHYNTGAISTASWVKLFIKGDLKGAEASLKSWNKVNGKVVQGLVDRRKAEADLFFRGKWSNDGKVTEYKVTPSGNVDWKSAKRISVVSELRQAMSPAQDSEPTKEGFWSSLVGLLASIFGK